MEQFSFYVELMVEVYVQIDMALCTIGRLHELTQEKLKGLAAQRDQIETTLAQLHSCLHFMRESLRPGNEGDVLMMKANTVRRVKELTTPFKPDFLEPNTKPT